MYPFFNPRTRHRSHALIDHPHLHYLPTRQMINSGHIERLFRNETITFDPKELRIRIR